MCGLCNVWVCVRVCACVETQDKFLDFAQLRMDILLLLVNPVSCISTCYNEKWGHALALQAGRSRVRFPMVSLEFFIYIILPAALWSLGRTSV